MTGNFLVRVDICVIGRENYLINLLKMQRMLLRKLAAEKNRLKELTKNSDRLIANFDKQVQDLKEMIRFMQY